MPYYSVRHVTRFQYSSIIHESVMELRMRPRNEGLQRRYAFDLTVAPRAHVMQYRDFLGNTVHHFNIPGKHSQLLVTATALIEMSEPNALPDSMPASAWQDLDTLIAENDYWETLTPSHFAQPTKLLKKLASEIALQRRDDPLTLLRELTSAVHETFGYVQNGNTKADSPIDDALKTREGVCQDFTHVMIALCREVGIPARYVSGYLFHRDDKDQSVEDATHAWVEALLPELGWVGFDPTNNALAGKRHIRVAIGRDYADVPPTKGVFRGDAETTLKVVVQVRPAEDPVPTDDLIPTAPWTPVPAEEEDDADYRRRQQQQQQQQ